MGTAHVATWANFHEVFWGLPEMQIMHRTSYGRNRGLICISGGFHCMPWVPTALPTQAWSYCRSVSDCTAAIFSNSSGTKIWLVVILHLLQLACVLMGAPFGVIITGPISKVSVLEDKTLADFSHLLWKLGNRATHKLSRDAGILTNPLGMFCMKRDWDNPERMKKSKMVLIYFPVCRAFTKQGLGATSKPNCCFSIRAFIEASE